MLHIHKSTLEIYRDCLKMIPIMVKEEKKIKAVRKLVSDQFRKNIFEYDNEKIMQQRENAIRALSNYLLYTIKQDYVQNPQKYKNQNIHEEEQQTIQINQKQQ